MNRTLSSLKIVLQQKFSKPNMNISEIIKKLVIKNDKF